MRNICHVEKSLFDLHPRRHCSSLHMLENNTCILKFQNLTKITFQKDLCFRRLTELAVKEGFSKTFAYHWNQEYGEQRLWPRNW